MASLLVCCDWRELSLEGVDHVINVRLDTAEIVANRGRNSKTAAIEIFAYGTGVHVAKPTDEA